VTRRGGTGASWESWIDRQIREAEERGEFDDLPGAGRPLPDLERPYDELWWVKKLMQRENLSVTPPTMQVRLERERALERIGEARSEDEVRRIVSLVNDRIREVNAKAASGPPSNLMPIDVDEALRRWREAAG
jgi:hypothetical protein